MPLFSDLVMAFPRMLARAGSFGFITVPERIENIFGLKDGPSIIAAATGNGTHYVVSKALSGTGSQAIQSLGARADTGGPAAAATEGASNNFNSISLQQVRNFGGIFAYMTSRWALCCFTLVSLQFVMHPHGEFRAA